MSTSENKRAMNPMLKGLISYFVTAVFCLVFFLVYDRFSHGVHSPFMTWLFAFPLVLGALPCALLFIFNGLPRPQRLAVNFYNSGIAALTVSSVIRGVFEIAGTDSIYQQWLMVAGAVMLLSGIILWIVKK